MRRRRAEFSCNAIKNLFSQQTALPLPNSTSKFVFVQENLRISGEAGNAYLGI